MSEFLGLIRFSQEAPAQLLASYLRQQGIVCKVDRTPPVTLDDQDHASDGDKLKTSFMLSIKDESRKAAALAIANEFLANPQAKKFQAAAWDRGDVASQSGRIMGNSTLPSVRDLAATPFTVVVISLCLFVYLSSLVGYFSFWDDALSIQYFAELTQNQQWWRLFGPNFLHFSLTHIVFNLIWWWIFGSQLERIFGSFWLVVLFVVASLFANVSQLLVSGPNFGGMSGVVYALFGFVWWIGWLRPNWGISIPNGFVVFLLLWLALGYADVLFVQMANEAHLFGLIAGCLLAGALHLFVKQDSG
ncbi:rhomboid family intramembrane serine protease GlpG [Ningiella sp. W23]|uniref:rhomboid family intramembrane serine protease GlpG n=1 Tax=Ningiella sp. W23 TaxID=3023715 RepID=UPI003756DFE7